MATKKRNRRKQGSAQKTARVKIGEPSNTYKAKEIISRALYTLLKEFINEYDYGPCIMVGIENKDVFIYWKHWSKINWRDAPKVYLGKIKHELDKPIYLWLD